MNVCDFNLVREPHIIGTKSSQFDNESKVHNLNPFPGAANERTRTEQL